jgi:hypothetical protein
MASLDKKVLSQRNNFNIFLNRIRTGGKFVLSDSNGKIVKIDKSILNKLSTISHLDRFAVGRSIIFPTTSGETIRLNQIFKDSEFVTRTQKTLLQESIQIVRVNRQLNSIFDKLGVETIPLKVGSIIYQVGLCENTIGNPKCDFHFIGINEYVGHVSHKAGDGPKGFQQWSGTSQKLEPLIYDHPETQSFINDLKEIFPNGIVSGTTVARRIKDENLKKIAVYGSGYGGSRGENNVDVVMQGLLNIQNRGQYYELTCSSHKLNNGDKIDNNYEPVFILRRGDRNDHGIKNARIVIQPIGSRSISRFV